MQITVLGVTRPLGAHAAKKALDHGHTVCVLVRHGEKSIPASVRLHENAGTTLQVFDGDATDEVMLKEATYKSDAVLNFVGGRYNLKTTVVSDSTQKLVGILPRTVKVVVISQIGIGQSRQYQNVILRYVLLDWIMAGLVKDKMGAEAALEDSELRKWTVLRPGRLTNWREKLDKVKFVSEEKSRVSSKVSRQDVAVVALKLVEGGYGDEYWRKTLSLVSG